MPKFIIRPGVDLVEMLKSRGYSTYYMGKHSAETFGNSTLKKFRDGGLPSWGELAKLCGLLHVSPVALIAFQTDSGTIFDLNGQRLTQPQPQPPQPAPSSAYDDDWETSDDSPDDYGGGWYNSAPDD